MPEPGLETRLSASTPALLNAGAIGGGVGIIFGEQILLDLHDAGLAVVVAVIVVVMMVVIMMAILVMMVVPCPWS